MTWQYVAGFFDGEGSITHNGEGFRVSIPQTNEEVLKEIQRFTGMGHVCKVTKRMSHWKDQWTYYVARQRDIYRFAEGIAPYTVVKRKQIVVALPKLKVVLQKQRVRKAKHERRERRARALRGKGFAYWRIGEMMGGLDRSYIRRIILGIGGSTKHKKEIK